MLFRMNETFHFFLLNTPNKQKLTFISLREILVKLASIDACKTSTSIFFSFFLLSFRFKIKIFVTLFPLDLVYDITRRQNYCKKMYSKFQTTITYI